MDGLDQFVHKGFIEQEFRFSKVYHYLDRYVDPDVFTVSDGKGDASVRQGRTVWIFWMQGMEDAPPLVRRCYESVCRNVPEDFDVILLTGENLGRYVDLPEFVWRKHRDGHISLTHLSDLIRLELLCTYGGCWVDATVFCSGPIPGHMLCGDLFLFKMASVMADPVLKMSSWWIAADRTDRVVQATRNVLYRFWEAEDQIRDYFLLHIAMSKLIDEDALCNVIFQGIPYFNSGDAHVLQGKLGEEYDEAEWEIIKDISAVHKLSYKRKYLQGDIYHYYAALVNGGLR